MMKIKDYYGRALGYLFVVALCFGGFGCKKKRIVEDVPHTLAFKNLSSDAFALVFLTNQEGMLAPCGCTSNPLGGIDRFVAVYNDIKQALHGQLAIIDTGNLLFDSAKKSPADFCQEDKRVELLLTSLTRLGLKKTWPHGFDDARGISWRNNLYQKFGLTDFNSHEIYLIDASSYKIAVLVVTGDSLEKDRLPTQKLIDMAKKDTQVKVIIAISQMPLAATKNFFQALPVDIVIQAQTDQFALAMPERIGGHGPLLINGARQGQYLTALVFENITDKKGPLTYDDRSLLRDNREDLLKARLHALEQQKNTSDKERRAFILKRIELAQKELIDLQKTPLQKKPDGPLVSLQAIALTKKIEPDAQTKRDLDEYEKNLPAYTKKCEENITCPVANPQQPQFVGAQTCKTCHEQAYQVWMNAVSTSSGLDEHGKTITRTMGHSKAWKTLTDMGKDSDRSCIGCHSIGFMEPGGYCKSSEVAFRINVQCESCHGAGSLHAQSGDKKFIKRNVTEETCRSCHHVPHIESYESFNYEDRLVKILGKGHGEQLLKQIIHKKKALQSP